jgi:hypothetical protein
VGGLADMEIIDHACKAWLWPAPHSASCRTHLTLWVEDAIPVTCSCVAANSVQR